MPRGYARIVLFVALAIPVVVSLLVWPRVADVVFPESSSQTEVRGVAATPVRERPGAVPNTAAPSPSAGASASPSPSPMVVVLASPSSDTSLSPSPVPSSPGEATPIAGAPTAKPSATAQPATALTTSPPPPATATPPPQVAQTVPQPSLAEASAVGAVRTFYQHVAKHEYSAAEALWSQHMRETFPPQENLVRRFTDTTAIDLREARLVSLDDAGGRAAVYVDLVETVGSQGSRRHYQGTWYLARSDGQWLLDQPDLDVV